MKALLIALVVLMMSNLIVSCGYRHHAYVPCEYRLKSSECVPNPLYAEDADLIATSRQAVDHLLETALIAQHLAPRRLIMTTIADIDDLDQSSALGRLIGEQLSVRFVEHGYTVIEPKMRHTVEATPLRGEFVMSRYLRELGRLEDASAAVGGTYAVGEDTVYVTLKLLSFYNGQILASHAYTLPLGANTYALLHRKRHWWQYR